MILVRSGSPLVAQTLSALHSHQYEISTLTVVVAHISPEMSLRPSNLTPSSFRSSISPPPGENVSQMMSDWGKAEPGIVKCEASRGAAKDHGGGFIAGCLTAPSDKDLDVLRDLWKTCK